MPVADVHGSSTRRDVARLALSRLVFRRRRTAGDARAACHRPHCVRRNVHATRAGRISNRPRRRRRVGGKRAHQRSELGFN